MGQVPTHGDWCVKVRAYPTFCRKCHRRVIYFECSCGGKVFLDPPREGPHEDSCTGFSPETPFDNCLVCGQPLTNPESRRLGAGPICRARDLPHVIVMRTIRGVDVNAANEDGVTRLHLLARHAGWLERLTPEERNLHKVSNDESEELNNWLAKEANIHARDVWGETPLHYAAAAGACGAISALVAEEGADVNVRDNRGNAPAHAAAAKVEFEAMIKLADHKADMSARNNDGETPLHLAVRAETAEIVEEVVKNGKAPHFAATADVPEVVDYSMSAVSVPDNSGITPLHYALSETTIKKLLDCGAPVNSQTKDGETPLDWADKKNNGDAIRELERRGGKRKEEL